MKLDLKKMSGAICSRDKRKGSCTPSDNSRGAFDSRRGRNKTEEYKPPKGRIKFDDDEPVVTGRGSQEKPYERDFAGDVSPSGFGGGEGKKGTQWKTVENVGIKYGGQRKNTDNPAAGLSQRQLKKIAKKKGQTSSEFFANSERFKNNLGVPK